ncbi:MAG: GNAT family N-acetyltransferase [Pseudomonadota bacterium]
MAALDATWPAAEQVSRAGWDLRRGAGGGQRVSAARGMGDLAVAEAAMAAWGQAPVFCVAGDDALDAMLEAAGYLRHDPVVLYAAPVAALDDGRDETARVIRCQTPVARGAEIWQAGGIGPARLAVMERVRGPKSVLMGRDGDRPAGMAFVACDGEGAMVHAIEVLPGHRRSGVGERLLRGAASFAREAGAAWLSLAVTEANGPANALYGKLGMRPVGHYHYRVRKGAP